MWLSIVYDELIKFCAETYQSINPNIGDDIKYPYLTYDHHDIPGEPGRFESYLDIEVFDNKGSNKLPLETLAQNISDHFERGLFSNGNYAVQSEFMSNKPIPTQSIVVGRRLIQIKLKIDRRI